MSEQIPQVQETSLLDNPGTGDASSAEETTEVKQTVTGSYEADSRPRDEEPVEDRWYNQLPEHLKNSKQVTKFDTLEKLAEGYVNASKLIGKRIGDMSKEEISSFVDPEVLKDIYKTQGVPEKPDDYDIKHFEKTPPEIKSKIYTKAHELGIPKDSLAALAEMNMHIQQEQQAKIRENWRNEAVNTFGKEINSVLTHAKKAVTEFGGESLKQYLNQTGLGDNPEVIKLFAKIGKQMGGDAIPYAASTPSNSLASAEAIEKQIEEMRSNPRTRKAYLSGDPKVTAKLKALHEQLLAVESRG